MSNIEFCAIIEFNFWEQFEDIQIDVTDEIVEWRRVRFYDPESEQ